MDVLRGVAVLGILLMNVIGSALAGSYLQRQPMRLREPVSSSPNWV
jgi:uncharacterized membrane protein YeiB